MSIIQKITFVTAIIVFTTAVSAFSQERETAAVSDLRSAYETAKTVAEDIAEKRQTLGTEQAARLFVQALADSQKLLEPVITLIAKTNAPKEAQQYAISVAIAVKETDLALWLYINAFVSNQQRYLTSGDNLLREGLAELDRASSLASAHE